MRVLCLIYFFFGLGPQLCCQELIVNEAIIEENITSHFHFLVDSENQFEIEHILSNDSVHWNSIDTDYFEYRRGGKGKVWYKLSFNNQSAKTLDYVLTFQSDIEVISHYLVSDEIVIESGLVGRGVKPSAFLVEYRQSSIPISIKSKETLDLYFSIPTKSLFYETFILRSANKFLRYVQSSSVINGVLYGLLFSLSLISILIYLITKSYLHFFYCLYCISNSFTLYVAKGELQFLVFPDLALGHGLQFICVLATSIFFFKFIVLYYRNQGLHRLFNHIWNGYAACMIIMIVLIYVDQYTSYNIVIHPFMERLPMLLMSFVCIVSLTIIYYFFLSSRTFSNAIMALAFSFLLFMGFTTILIRNGYYPTDLVTKNGYPIAVVLEFIFLTGLMGNYVFRSYSDRLILSVKLENQEKELEQAELIKKAHDEKDTLLREIHHRVKNNLQVISALLTLQSSHLKDAQAKTALQEGQDRVQSMALIHKDLYQHDNLKGVNTKDYLEQLVENLLRSYKIDESEVKLNLDIAEINLDVDTMIPMGLMVNELISNALKHAFKESENAVLDISLTEQNDQLKMTIADNGSGVGDIEEMKKQSFGYSLVQSFARKLDADLHIESVEGLKIDLTIKNYLKV